MNTLDQINALYPPPPLQLGIEKIAVILDVAEGSIYNLKSKIKKGEIAPSELPPIHKQLGKWVVSRQALANWMDGKTEETTSNVRICRRGRPPKKQTQFLEQLTFELKRLQQLKIDAFCEAENGLKNDLNDLLNPKATSNRRSL